MKCLGKAIEGQEHRCSCHNRYMILMEKKLSSHDSSQSSGILNHQQECKGVQIHIQHYLHIELPSHRHKPHNMYIEWPPREQTKQDRHA